MVYKYQNCGLSDSITATDSVTKSIMVKSSKHWGQKTTKLSNCSYLVTCILYLTELFKNNWNEWSTQVENMFLCMKS